MKIVIEEVQKHHNRKQFDCGVLELNRFLARTARQHASRHISRTYVLRPAEEEREQILGYYSLAYLSVELPDGAGGRLAGYPHPLPALKLARLAVDGRHQKQGYGELLLVDAICRTVKADIAAGALIGLFVDAKDERALRFYQHYGFYPVDAEQPQTPHVWLPINACQKVALLTP